jgi:hypothetical protein
MMTTVKSSKTICILGSLFVVLSIGLSSSVAGQYNSKDQETGRDGDCIAYACGVVWDTMAKLEWVVGPEKDTTWDEAKSWGDNLTVAGGGWRMPTIDELKTLYDKGRGTRNITPLLKTGGWAVWSGDIRDSSSAWFFHFNLGKRYWGPRNSSTDIRTFAVRSRK